MSTHLRSFLRRTPLESLRAYLSDVSATGFAEIDWEAPSTALVDTLIETIPVLDDPARDRVYSDVDRIGQFMNDPECDLLKMAEGQGAKAFGQCKTLAEMEKALAEAIAVVDAGGVALVDIRIEQISRVDADQIKKQSDR